MWCRAGYDPVTFWEQTPATFHACMDGVRERLESEAEGQISMAWHTAAFTAATQTKGGLKPLKQYLSGKAQTAQDMLTSLKTLGAGSNMKIRRVRRQEEGR